MSIGESTVWLFFENNSQNLIGYGSLGPINIPVGDKSIEAWLIPYFGVSTNFQGQPKSVDRRYRYARRIFQSLIDEAKLKETHRNLFLYVDFENTKAIESFYPDFGFAVLSTEIDETAGRTWILMHRDLAD